MGQGIVKVSACVIESLLFGGQVKIVEVCPVPEYVRGDPSIITFVIEGPGLPKVNDLGLPRPVSCTVTETRRTVEFKPTD